MDKISFIGIGNMGSAMALAALKKLPPKNICISDSVQEKAEKFVQSHSCICARDNMEAAKFGKYLVVSVKAVVLPGVLEEIRPALEEAVRNGEEKVLVPIAAGVMLENIRDILGKGLERLPIIRVLPTVYAFLGCGLMSCAVGDARSAQEYSHLVEMLEAAGTFKLMEEKMVDLASTASGCTPAFTAMFIEALADGMVLMGMPRNQAVDYVARGVYGGAAMVLENDRHPGQIKDSVCSPGGSTIVGVKVLEEYNFRYAAMEAVCQAAKKVLGKD